MKELFTEQRKISIRICENLESEAREIINQHISPSYKKIEELITDKKEFSYAIKGFQKAWTGGKEWSNSISEKKLSQSFLFSR